VIALALVVVAVAIAFAVPPARSEILRWLGIGNARIEFVDHLPDVHPRRQVDLGPRTSLDDARQFVSYHVLTPRCSERRTRFTCAATRSRSSIRTSSSSCRRRGRSS
jgi:hypothetical protein